MRTSIRYSTLSRISGAIVGLWLCGAGGAWAGDGADLGSLQALLSGTGGLCQIFKMTSCPTVPTITQGVLEVAALGNNVPEMVRAQNSIPAGTSVTAGNPAAAPPTSGSLTPLPLDSTTTPTVSEFLSTLTPLAFISQSSGTGQATPLYNTSADTFLYAVGVSSRNPPFVGPTGLTDPDAAYFFYEDLLRTGKNFANGQTVAKFSLPLTVLNTNGTERPVPTTLKFTATTAGDCSASSVVGDFNGTGTPQTVTPPNAIGIDCAVVFSASPTSTQTHAIFEVAVPLLVTGACPSPGCPPKPNTDPAYFYTLHHPGPPVQANPINTGVFTAFEFDDANGILAQGASIGLAPTAGPLGPPPANGASAAFGLCGSLPTNTNGSGAQLRPAVGAYYGMATSGEMLLSAPLPAAFTNGGTPPSCPPL